jgi:ABC-type cobalamin/Fe3+-siderophores transport system ATPase subunit
LALGYSHRQVIRDVSLVCAPRTMTAVIGPNGAGKSTLMKSLNGGITPQKGQVLLDGKPMSTLSRKFVAQKITMVAQEAELRFPVTVTEFVMGGRYASSDLTWLGWESDEDMEAVFSALAETELLELSDRLMAELSGGERQRALMARSLATRASILLLDEPTANLDLSHQAAMLTLVRSKCDLNDCSAVVVTHDINLAAEFADSILLLQGGRMVAFGPPSTVLTKELMEEVFAIRVVVDQHPVSGAPRVTPIHSLNR